MQISEANGALLKQLQVMQLARSSGGFKVQQQIQRSMKPIGMWPQDMEVHLHSLMTSLNFDIHIQLYCYHVLTHVWL